MLHSPTLHIYTHALQLQDDGLHTKSTSTSLPSPTSSADPCSPSESKASTISQGPSLSQISRSSSQELSSSLATPTFAADTRYQSQRLIARHQGTSHTRSQSFCSQSTSIPSNIVRNGKSETHLYGLIENSSYLLNPNTQSRMLAAEGTPATCFTLTSPLLPPSLANTSATAPPPSSSSNSRKKPKTRLTLNSLPRYSQQPSHAQPHMSTGLSSPMNTHYQYNAQPNYQYNAQPNYQYSQHSYAQQQSNYLSAQQQLQIHQKDLIQQATRGSLPSHLLFPSSPRLIPMGSPGPVTPLTLEEAQGGYLFAGSPSSTSGMPFMQQRDMDKLAAIAASQN
ncbi:hypothetical protein EV426DRAFT_301855 [Tirmania nivea]|nr:hypothetical protein EV426DRAFT_301855 [Tirmania nivea]